MMSGVVRLFHLVVALSILTDILLSHEVYRAAFNLVACDFVRFHLIVILKQNESFSFNI